MNDNFKISLEEGLHKLNLSGKEFINLFNHGTLEVELYQPNLIDKQEPHEKDEIYIIASGSGKFFNEGKNVDVMKGDFVFVQAGNEHRFFDFSDDFSTWVIFYGPKGGEK